MAPPIFSWHFLEGSEMICVSCVCEELRLGGRDFLGEAAMETDSSH